MTRHPRRNRQPRKRVRQQRARHCPSGKAWYRTKLDAMMALARVQDGPRRAYPCPMCGSWHLTSQVRR